MPEPVPFDRSDPIQGNGQCGGGKKTKAALAIGAAISAALLAAAASKNQAEADKHFAEAGRLQQKAQDSLAGKGKPKSAGTTVYDMFGEDDRDQFAAEPQLASPNANSFAKASF